MKYLLDTTVIEELIKNNKPNQNLKYWIEGVNKEELYASYLSLDKIRSNIDKIEKQYRKEQILNWFQEDVSKWFKDRLIPVNLEVVQKSQRLPLSNLENSDSLIAATALVYDLKFVVKHIYHFKTIKGLSLFNPWSNTSYGPLIEKTNLRI